MKKIRVTIWHEYAHEKTDPNIRALYPEGMHAAIRDGIQSNEDFDIRIVDIDEPEQGLPAEILDNTDVLLWWGHMRHGDVSDSLADRIRYRVIYGGMGFVALHSAHQSKLFTRIIGTSGDLVWGDEQPEIVWNLLPQHPIAEGIPEHFLLPSEEMYGEPFCIAQPDELVFTSWFKNGNIFRSGCCFYRGIGKIFYFQPGHESCKSYYDPNCLRIIANAIRWAAPTEKVTRVPTSCPYVKSVVEEYGI